MGRPNEPAQVAHDRGRRSAAWLSCNRCYRAAIVGRRCTVPQRMACPGGVGTDSRSTSGRQVAFQSVEWGRNLSGAHGPGVLEGRLEMVIDITPVFVAFQSGDAEGAGFSPIMFRWTFRQYRAIQPFVDAAAGMIVTNRDVPENTTRLNFAEHAGVGARFRVAERWAVVAGYRLHHVSNNGTAARNPGVTSHVGYAGVSWMTTH